MSQDRLLQQFGFPEVAEKELEKQLEKEMDVPMQCRMTDHEISKPLYLSKTECTNNMKALMSKVKDEDQPSLLSLLYGDLAASNHSLNIPSDHLQLSLHAFKHFKENGRVKSKCSVQVC